MILIPGRAFAQRQWLGPSQPLFCKLFQVGMAALAINYMKTRTFYDQFVFQMKFPCAILSPPSTSRRKVERTEKFPFLSHLHKGVSSSEVTGFRGSLPLAAPLEASNRETIPECSISC